MRGVKEYIPRRSELMARRGALIATVIYLVAIFAALYFTQCNNQSQVIEQQLYSNVMMISLGDSDMGQGEVSTSNVSLSAP